MASNDWIVWQLADSAFPTGGFAHSGGLEAAWQLGLVTRDRLETFLGEVVEHVCAGAVPVVSAVNAEPDRFAELDLLVDASLSNHVANRASRVQGAALVSTAASSFKLEPLVALKARVRAEKLPSHLAPAFGAVTRALGVERPDAARLFAFLTLRSLVSSAVRLGAIGPLEGQGVQYRLGAVAENVSRRYLEVAPDELAQTSPLVEVFQAQHDRLYSRLFSS